MTTFSDFSSLLQLGVGVGIGLSLFRAPVDLRVARISRILDRELLVLRGVSTSFANTKRRDMLDLRLNFAGIREQLEREQIPFMVAAVFGAAANLAILILAAFHPAYQPSHFCKALILIAAVLWFLLLLGALELLARWRLSALFRALRETQSRKERSV